VKALIAEFIESIGFLSTIFAQMNEVTGICRKDFVFE
jgi:hypothetical protein